jgi:hypothetical protein
VRHLRLPLTALALLVPTLVAVLVTQERDGARPPSPAVVDRSHVVPVELRTLVVSRDTVAPSRPGRPLQARLVHGSMPTGLLDAVVLSDEDCAPNALGISNCRNMLRLPSGATLVVRHRHDMRTVPCLTPGEHVVVRPV